MKKNMYTCIRCTDTPAKYQISRAEGSPIPMYVCEDDLVRAIRTITEREPETVFTVRRLPLPNLLPTRP